MSHCTVKPVKREVIENKLLAALDNKAKVALLLSKKDLVNLIAALSESTEWTDEQQKWMEEFRADMEQLRNQAFP